MAKEYSSHSKFTAGAFANYFATLLVGLVSSITCGIATPWILCWYMRFIANHTFINGKQVIFEGSGGSLFGNYIKWLLLSFITFGIYWLVAGQVNLAQWLFHRVHKRIVHAIKADDLFAVIKRYHYKRVDILPF